MNAQEQEEVQEREEGQEEGPVQEEEDDEVKSTYAASPDLNFCHCATLPGQSLCTCPESTGRKAVDGDEGDEGAVQEESCSLLEIGEIVPDTAPGSGSVTGGVQSQPHEECGPSSSPRRDAFRSPRRSAVHHW